MLLHGWGLNGAVWDEVAAALEPRGKVLVPDLPGYGSEPAVAPGLDALVGWLGERAPHAGVWVGWSLGATVLLAAASAIGGPRPRAVVLVAATPCFAAREGWRHGVPTAHLEAFRDALARDYAGTLRRFMLMLSGDPAACRRRAGRTAAACAARGAPAATVLAGGLALLRDADLRCGLQGLTMPVTVVHGARDAVVPPQAGGWLAQNLPQARLVEIPGAGHAPFMDAPDVFCALLEEVADAPA